ncbi:DUF2064 domain-containing protein [Phaeodactylibacter sp.]|uniref:TIGR04282 family arsenosugar biosynthesis glycosyltransferase n=1 Tax=Phaeodactylibacter sp. TaxID=1940289 RepID=UPI0025EFAEAF|nr:DUF2064 domain-containing protein [Phaeodactylibacter sp.]MCI4650254.1 DUF2064 domain-containing protein [Phaeodactylibacter sp.]MCI5092529.1 DUF2064 domain-containing protein [Phaeodactylibacter sp.]
MSTQLHSTALLLFLRNEQDEARCKPLAGSQKASTALFRRFNRYAIKQARRTGLPLFVIQGDQQVGGTFGERLSNAYQAVFDLGYERVIAIGNDCPELNTGVLLQAAGTLEDHGLVLGPTQDGGAYLIGLQRSAFDPTAFANLPWQTDTVYEALQALAGDAVAVLSTSFDVDHPGTLSRQFWRLPITLRRVLSCLIGQVHGTVFQFHWHPFHLIFLRSLVLRAPPFAACL